MSADYDCVYKFCTELVDSYKRGDNEERLCYIGQIERRRNHIIINV
jgi:hypothetical protein